MSRIWETHELSPGHRQAVAVVALLEQCKMDLVGFTFYSGSSLSRVEREGFAVNSQSEPLSLLLLDAANGRAYF